jgi:hypothetical protein
MVTKLVYVVYVLPIVLSIIFGSVVLADVLQEPGRKLSMWPSDSNGMDSTLTSIEIIGLEKQYTTSTPVQIQVQVNDPTFDCGDLYITIYSSRTSTAPITQSGFLDQCFAINGKLLPVDDQFSEIIAKPGQYELLVKMNDPDQKNSITASEKFTIK